MSYVRACYKVVKAVTRGPWSPWVSSFLMKRTAHPWARLEAVGAKPNKAQVRKKLSLRMGHLVCHKKVRASLLSNNFASKWWAHCTVLPLLDEGWGRMVKVGPSAPWSATRKWEPHPCRAQRAGYRALLHSVSLCYLELIDIISTKRRSIPRLFNRVITKERRAQRMASLQGRCWARRGRRHGV